MIYAHFVVANTINAHFFVAKMIWAHLFCCKNNLHTFFLSQKLLRTCHKKNLRTFFCRKNDLRAFFVAKNDLRTSSGKFLRVKVAIQKVQTFWASALGQRKRSGYKKWSKGRKPSEKKCEKPKVQDTR